MTRLACWLRVFALVGCIVQRIAVLFVRRVCAAWWTSVAALPPVRQQLLDPAVQLRGHPREHILQVSPGIVSMELGRLQQAHHHRSPLAGQLTANEQPIAPPQRPGPHLVFDVVIVDRHRPVSQEPPESGPVVQAVVDRLGNRAALRHPSAFKSQPGVQLFPQRLALALTSSSNFLRA